MNTALTPEALVTVVGVPEDGCLSLSSKAVNAVSQARVVAGNRRHLEWFPQFNGKFIDMADGFGRWLNHLVDESEEGGVVVLASGDPLFFGIGSTLERRIGKQALAFIPTLSSVQLAFSRLVQPWQDARFISLHGREIAGLVTQLQQGDLFALLTDSKNTPQAIARHLCQYHEACWTLTVCEDLQGRNEQLTRWNIQDLANSDASFHSLNVVVLQRTSQVYWGGNDQYSEDDAFEKRMPKAGLITKQPVRHLALAAMKLRRDDTVWDIGAGSGSMSIEAAKQSWQGQVFAIECNQDCYEGITNNIFSHGVDNVTLVKEKAPLALTDLPQPDAVFVGGSRGEMNGILNCVWEKLKPQGRLVCSAVTVDTVTELYQWAKQAQCEMQVQLVNVATTVPLASYQRYQAENPIHLFIFKKATD